MELHYLDLLEVGQLIAARGVSPVEVTEALLRRIDRLDPMLKSYVLVNSDLAMNEARAAEAEITKDGSRGPIHGVPIALKDLFDIHGVSTAAGMPIRRHYTGKSDATVVRRLREAGAIFLGNLKMTEGAHSEHHPAFEAPLNPWNHDLWPGASSSGAGVATAAGLCYAAMGTDTGGSIRFPAAVNGVTGLKPTWGRVSRAGVFELAALLDHVGPLARSAADAGAVLGTIAGPDPGDPTAAQVAVPDYLADLSVDLRGVRIGLDSEAALGASDPAVEAAITASLDLLKSLGARIVAIRLPDLTPMARAYLPLSGVQTALAHAETYPSQRHAYGKALSQVIELGLSLSAVDYHRLLLQQLDFRSRLHAVFEGVDLFAVPGMRRQIRTTAQQNEMTADEIEELITFTSPFSMSGHPTISVPCGFDPNGGPVSLQLVGPYFGEAILIKAANAFQRITDWHKQHPIP